MMKHALRVLFLCCLVAVALLPGATAQTSSEVCYPDCPGSTWGQGDHRIVVLPNGCKVTVDYMTRCACGVWNDVFVHSITPDPGDPDCAFLQTLPLGQAVEMITQEMLEGSPFDFPPPCRDDLAVGQCSTRWRVIKGSCWTRVSYPSSNEQYYIACSQTACCLKPYQVCRTECGRTVTPSSTQPPSGSCVGAKPPYPNPDISGPCEPVCG